MASYPSVRNRSVSSRDAFIAVLLLALITILGGCGSSTAQPSGRTPSPTKKELKGTITEFPLPTSNSAPAEIITGPDGNLWFVEGESNKIGRITPSGTITEFPLPASNSGPWGITTGPDGNLWFTEAFGDKIGRIM